MQCWKVRYRLRIPEKENLGGLGTCEPGKFVSKQSLQAGCGFWVAGHFKRTASLNRTGEVVDKGDAGRALRQVLLDSIAREVIDTVINIFGKCGKKAPAFYRLLAALLSLGLFR